MASVLSAVIWLRFVASLLRYHYIVPCVFADWDGLGDHDRVHRQLSVSSDSKLLDEDIREEARVILRPKKPPRPKSEVFLNKEQQRRTKRYSAFGVSPSASPQWPGGNCIIYDSRIICKRSLHNNFFPLCNIYIYIYIYICVCVCVRACVCVCVCVCRNTSCSDSDFCLCSCSSVEFV
jgi:hypothetical protein